jgi:hypothetical protein
LRRDPQALSNGYPEGEKMKKSFVLLILLGAVFLCTAHPAFALKFGFDNITNNSAVDAAIGEAQLFIEVTDPGGSQVLFTFLNIGSDASSITDVYFDDGSLDGIASIDNSDPGVSFSQGVSPGDLPGGNTISPPFVVTEELLADSEPPVQANGVNPGESLGIFFDLQFDQNFSEVINELFASTLRVGIHVQGFDGGGSESFVNDPNPIPEPATMLLVGSGLIGLAGIGRKRFFKKS